jgi:transcriptional regulator with XRE-family HTH domain
MVSIMVGSAVRSARKRAGISQAQLAEKAGTSQPSIARLERGRVSPTIISLEHIAKALGAELVIDFEPTTTEAHQARGAPDPAPAAAQSTKRPARPTTRGSRLSEPSTPRGSRTRVAAS